MRTAQYVRLAQNLIKQARFNCAKLDNFFDKKWIIDGHRCIIAQIINFIV